MLDIGELGGYCSRSLVKITLPDESALRMDDPFCLLYFIREARYEYLPFGVQIPFVHLRESAIFYPFLELRTSGFEETVLIRS